MPDGGMEKGQEGKAELAPHPCCAAAAPRGSWSYHSTNLARPSVLSSSHATLHGPLGGQMWPQDIPLLLSLLPQVSLALAHKREQDFLVKYQNSSKDTNEMWSQYQGGPLVPTGPLLLQNETLHPLHGLS